MIRFLLPVILCGLPVVSCVTTSKPTTVQPGPRVHDDYLVTEAVTDTSVTLSWKEALPRPTTPGPLAYRLFISRSNNITTAGDAIRNGTPVGDWAPGTSAATIGGLPPKTGWFVNVVVRATNGLASAYRAKRVWAHAGEVYRASVPVNDPGSALPAGWWRRAVFYECHVRMFQDGNGDGKGDFAGLIDRLDYLKNLGIGGIWLMPIAQSSDNDHGYNVTDYFAVEKDYGTLADFKRLLAEAHKRGIGVIIDFVVNHSSYKHPFFLESDKGGPLARYRPWYCWEDSKPGVWSIPEDLSDAWHQADSGWYFAGIARSIPDWNFRNPSVRAYLDDAVRFWLNLGVDGFRYDALANLYESGPTKTKSLPETFEYFRSVRRIVDQYANRYLVCENGDPRYLGSGHDQFHSAFAFAFNYTVRGAVAGGRPKRVARLTRDYLARAPGNARYATLLGNHDLFTGPRIATFFNGDASKAKLAATLLLLSPGIPYLYQGEEIGLSSKNYYMLGGDLALRTPMQWDASTNAGFSRKMPRRLVNDDYRTCNVEAESRDPASILAHYRRLGALRAASTALQDGGWAEVPATESRLYAFVRTAGRERVVVVCNFDAQPADATLDLASVLGGRSLDPGTDLYDPAVRHPRVDGGNVAAYPVSVPARGVRVLRFNM